MMSRRSSRSGVAVRYVKSGSESAAAVGLNQLEQLKSMSVVVCDSGEPDLVRKYKPQDCTTNPSLVFKAVQRPENRRFLEAALGMVRGGGGSSGQHRHHHHAAAVDAARPFARVADELSVILGAEMLKAVPGRVSTEVDAHLSHSSRASVDKALYLIDSYAAKGIEPNRVYIKLASTYDGVEACRRLQAQGIDTNMTLLFSFAQAAACADAGAALISPFVGRILDWHLKKTGRASYEPHEDPGVLSVRRIYRYYKQHKFPTIVMAASFRNVGEIRELAGVDNITIAPSLLDELAASTDPLPRKLSPDDCGDSSGNGGEPLLRGIDRAAFEALHGADEMAVEKLREGIDAFAADQVKLEALLAKMAAGE